MGSGNTKPTPKPNQFDIHQTRYLIENYDKFQYNIKDLRRYFLLKDLYYGRIDLNKTYFAGKLIYNK